MNGKILISILALIVMGTLRSMGQESPKNKIKLIAKESFEKIVDGKQITLYTLKSSLGKANRLTH